MQPPWLRHTLPIAALLLLNIVIKYSLWTHPPQTFTDSLSYLAPAIGLLDGRGYGSQENAYRTPTYPLFIAAILLPFDHRDLSTCREPRVPACLGDIQSEPNADANLRAIVSVQIVLGALTMLLVYFFAWRVARSVWIAALCALTYGIDLSTGYWEISLLTETLAAWLLMLAVCLTLIAAKSTRYRVLVHMALGIVLALLALCQPIYLVYAIVPASFLVVARSRQAAMKQSPTSIERVLRSPAPHWARRSAGVARNDTLIILLLPVFFTLAWSARVFFVDGFFTPSTLTGYNLTQMVGPFMEQAPASYRDLAEIYVDTRNERMPIRGTHSGTIFFAYREMLDARQTTWAGLSRDLTDLSLQLILKNPSGYLQVVWEAFNQFWKFGLGRQNPKLPITFNFVSWFFDSRVQQGAMMLFILSPLGLAIARNADRDAQWIWFAIATMWYVAIFSSALNFGDNERYRVPVARLQYSAIILTAWSVVKKFNRKDAKEKTSN